MPNILFVIIVSITLLTLVFLFFLSPYTLMMDPSIVPFEFAIIIELVIGITKSCSFAFAIGITKS
jgi:hypothetical protein